MPKTVTLLTEEDIDLRGNKLHQTVSNLAALAALQIAFARPKEGESTKDTEQRVFASATATFLNGLDNAGFRIVPKEDAEVPPAFMLQD